MGEFSSNDSNPTLKNCLFGAVILTKNADIGKYGYSHYNGANSYLFVNGPEIYKFKAKDSEVFVGPISLGNISKDWSVDNGSIKTRFTGYVYDFSVNYESITADNIKDIHKYLMEKNIIVRIHYS